jgi:asparagine synthase (glutamine-hydrolysing)
MTVLTTTRLARQAGGSPRVLLGSPQGSRETKARIIERERLTRRRYWRWTIAASPRRTPTPEAFDGVFREAVRRQSDAEVECGVFLSGGLDSSLVAAVAKDLAPQQCLRAYTLRFAEASYDEGRHAERIARHLGLEWTPVAVTPEALQEGVTDLVRTVGEPLADPAWVPTALLARRASRDARAARLGPARVPHPG